MQAAQLKVIGGKTQRFCGERCLDAMIFLAEDPAEDAIGRAHDAVAKAPYGMAGLGECGGGSGFPAFKMQAMGFRDGRKCDECRKSDRGCERYGL
jgi:hypothetical protein